MASARRLSIPLAALALVAAGLAATTPSAATPPSDPPWTTVASGLDNPRLLSFAHGALYVAEAGVGGAGPCMEGAEGGPVCFGTSGAITKVTRHHQVRVVEGLPSLAGEGGFSAVGPADVEFLTKHRFIMTLGLGNDPAVRDTLPQVGQLLGTVVTGKVGRHHWWHNTKRRTGSTHNGHGHSSLPRVVADLADFEGAHDPDQQGPDSNPTGLSLTWRGVAVTDSGGNTLIGLGKGGPAALAVFDSPGTATAPFPPFPEIAMQSVPTSVVQGPDKAWYVSELTGFPFAPGASRIHRIARDGTHTIYATGLTNVTDLAWYGRHLYAVQLANDGLLSAPEDELPTGSLVKVVPGGSPRTVVTGLPAPYGVAFAGGKAFLTTCSVCAGGGGVVSVSMH